MREIFPKGFLVYDVACRKQTGLVGRHLVGAMSQCVVNQNPQRRRVHFVICQGPADLRLGKSYEVCQVMDILHSVYAAKPLTVAGPSRETDGGSTS